MRELLVADDEVAGVQPLLREVRVRVDLRADDHVRTDDRANPSQQIALHIVVSMGNRGAVQAHDDGVDGQRGGDLVEDGVA